MYWLHLTMRPMTAANPTSKTLSTPHPSISSHPKRSSTLTLNEPCTSQRCSELATASLFQLTISTSFKRIIWANTSGGPTYSGTLTTRKTGTQWTPMPGQCPRSYRYSSRLIPNCYKVSWRQLRKAYWAETWLTESTKKLQKFKK